MLVELDKKAHEKPTSIANWVQHVVTELIFTGTLRPGDRLVESKLSRQLQVGISAVREALQQLQFLGLVSPGPGRGTYVTQLSLTQVRQIYRLRAELEALSVRFALELAERTGVEKLRECGQLMVEAARRQDQTRFFDLDREFHNLVCRIADDPYLEKCLVSLTTPLFAFVLIRLKQDSGLFDLAALAEQHLRIAELFTWSEPERAADEMRRIILGFQDEVLRKLYGKSEEAS